MLNLQIKRYILYWIYVLIALGIPILFINETYGLFETTTTVAGEFTKLRSTALIVILITAFFGTKVIVSWYHNVPDTSIVKHLGNKLILPVGLGVMWVILNFSDRYIENFTYVIYWSFISNAVALIFAVWHQNTLNQIVKAERLSGERK